jgi:hypothetical protein
MAAAMFQWYQLSDVCYAYLSDVVIPSSEITDWVVNGRHEASFCRSRWFTRGWTLQELIAPKRLVFYSSHWERMATKDEIPRLLQRLASIG